MKPIQKTSVRTRGHKLILALAALIVMAGASTPAASSKISRQVPGSNVVNVSVSLNMEIPMADESQEAIAAAQINGRKFCIGWQPANVRFCWRQSPQPAGSPT